MAPSRGYISASGDLFGLKLTEDIEQKLRKTMLVLFGHQAGFTQLFLAQLEKAIFTKQHFIELLCVRINVVGLFYRSVKILAPTHFLLIISHNSRIMLRKHLFYYSFPCS